MRTDTKRSKRATRLLAVVILTSTAVVGVSSAAAATPVSPGVTRIAHSVDPSRVADTRAVVPAPSPTPDPAREPVSTRGFPVKAAIDAALRIIKGIPGWWSKFSSGVKKAYSWFVKYVWNPLTAIANAIQIWVTGWDLWHQFH